MWGQGVELGLGSGCHMPTREPPRVALFRRVLLPRLILRDSPGSFSMLSLSVLLA